jgi:RHS repeat-associated protein
MQYAGPNVTTYTDVLTGTSYGMEYDCDGWLSRATASKFGTSSSNSALGQRYDQSFSHFLNKTIRNTCARQPTLENLERIVDTGQPGRTVDQTYHYDYLTQPAEGVRSINTVTTSGRGQSIKTDTYAYGGDNRGLLISHNGSEEQFNYDAQNRLTQIRRTAGVSETLGYDAFGALAKRVMTRPRQPRDAATATTLYYVGSDATVVQTNVGRSEPAVSIQHNVHILLEGVRIASVRNTFAPRLESSQSILYYHRDRLGSVVATSLAGGKPGASYRYTPYGALDVSQGVTAETESELGYTGARRLSGDLVNLNARVYDPRMRRFLQADDVDTLRYTYVAGDPVNRTDPTGHAWNNSISFRGWGSFGRETSARGQMFEWSGGEARTAGIAAKLEWMAWYWEKGHGFFQSFAEGDLVYYFMINQPDPFVEKEKALSLAKYMASLKQDRPTMTRSQAFPGATFLAAASRPGDENTATDAVTLEVQPVRLLTASEVIEQAAKQPKIDTIGPGPDMKTVIEGEEKRARDEATLKAITSSWLASLIYGVHALIGSEPDPVAIQVAVPVSDFTSGMYKLNQARITMTNNSLPARRQNQQIQRPILR